MLKDWLGRFLGDKLEGEIQTKQDILVRLDADVRAREQDLAKIAMKLSQLEAQQKSEIDALDLEEMLMRGRLQAEIIQSSDVKEDLESKIAELQERWQNSQAALVQIDRQVSELEERKTQLSIALNGLDKLLEQKQTLVQELDNAILNRQQNRFTSESSVDNQLETITSQVETPQDLDIDEENKLEDLPPLEELSSTSNLEESVDIRAVDREEEQIDNFYLHERLSCRSLYSSSRDLIIVNQKQDFTNPEYTKQLWQEQILPFWTHRDRPIGQRFLGSVQISPSKSEELLKIVSDNLKSLQFITERQMQQKFRGLERDWLKVFTFVVSEYAYYHSSDKFWKGFCDYLDIRHSQGIEMTFRNSTGQGINLLGLVKAQDGYKYVSTLWLQSGIPQHNIEHFSEIVKDLYNKYGWEHLAQTSPNDLAQILLQHTNVNYPQWRTLQRFLKESGENGSDPISGQILQSVAVIAQELYSINLSIEALLHDEEREKLLSNLRLPNSFFLRSWKEISEVINIQKIDSTRSKSHILQDKSPLLRIDIESLEIQVIVPHQELWDREWDSKRGEYCSIAIANWESNIPTLGALEIPELTIKIDSYESTWGCSLQDSNHQDIQKWEYPNVTKELPCLVFDAFTGEHIKLNPEYLSIDGQKQVFCFTPRDIEIDPSDEIEIIDRSVPCSLRGWRGYQLELIDSTAGISLKLANDIIFINWQLDSNSSPTLKGLQLTGRKTIYIDAPILSLPEDIIQSNSSLTIKNLSTQQILVEDRLDLLLNHLHQNLVMLDSWITSDGKYEVRVGDWNKKIEVQSNYQLNLEELQQQKIRVLHKGQELNNLPIQVENITDFWSVNLELAGLWAFERVRISLRNHSNREFSSICIADRTGNLSISVAQFYGKLPKSEFYELSYRSQGESAVGLLSTAKFKQNIEVEWSDRDLSISGLCRDRRYKLTYWNLLQPHTAAYDRGLQEVDSIIIPLDIDTGIYYFQILDNNESTFDLGWWSNLKAQQPPEKILEDDCLADYWYTIIGNESPQDFLSAITSLSIDINRCYLKAAIANLNKSVYFPEWLNLDSIESQLLAWLDSLPQGLPQEIIETTTVEQKTQISMNTLLENGQWHIVHLYTAFRQQYFCSVLNQKLEASNSSNTGIIKSEISPDPIYRNQVFVLVEDVSLARETMRDIEYFSSVEQRPLKSTEVRRILGSLS